MSRGRLEAQITVPTGGWDAALVGTASATATTPAGTYTITSLCTSISSTWSTATTDTVTATASLGESGTQLITITSDANLEATWTDTDQRDVLGFTGTLTPAAMSFVASNGCQGVWLPDCELNSPYGPNDTGHLETDMAQLVSPDGIVWTAVNNTRTRIPSLTWAHITRARARSYAETGAITSFETFWNQTQTGSQLSYFLAGAPITLVWDADTAFSGTNITTYYMLWDGTTAMQKVDEGWAGLFRIEIPGGLVTS